MKIEKLKPQKINQNGYHTNIFTKYRIGTLFIYPTDYTPDDCFSCEGYSLLIADYEDLYKIVGTKFNHEDDKEGTFRIPDYNITGRFLQPNKNAGTQIAAGLPNIKGAMYQDGINADSNNGIIWGCSGALYLASATSKVASYTHSGTERNVRHIYFDASRSNSLFGKNSTIQPASQTVHVCIKYK